MLKTMQQSKSCLLAGSADAALISGLAAAGYTVFTQGGPDSLKARRIDSPLETPEDARRVFSAVEGELALFVRVCSPIPQKSFLEMDEADFHQANRGNWRGTYFSVCEAGRRFASQGKGGCIVIVGSNRGSLTHPGESAEGGVAAALQKLTHYAALEYAKYGVRALYLARGREEGAVPLGGSPGSEELARWILLAASSPALTGAAIRLDGGEALVDQPIKYYGLEESL